MSADDEQDDRPLYERWTDRELNPNGLKVDSLAKRDIEEKTDPSSLLEVDTDRDQKSKDVLQRDALAQFNKLRPILFWYGLGAAGLCVLVSLVIAVWWHVAGSKLDTTVAVALISGLTVESLGIIAIIAHALFPSNEKQE